MRTKISKKGLSAVLIVSILGLGTGYNLPTVYAEDTGTEVSQISNTLSKLEIEGVKLDKDFSADINQYSATVENETDSIHILVEGTNANSIISINGKAITSGTADEYSLQTGQNIFLITVKDSTTNLTNTYTLTVNRKQNSDNQLQNIKLSTGKLSPTFSPSVTQYNVQLPNTTKTISILPTAKEQTAVVEVNGAEVTEKGVSVNIPVGKSDILIVVTAEDRSKLRYTIHVERQDSSSGNGAGSGQTGNSGSGQTGNSGSGQTGNSGSGQTGKSGSGQTGNSGSGQTGKSGSRQTGNSGSGQTGNSGSRQTGNSGSRQTGYSGSAPAGMTFSSKSGSGFAAQTSNSFSGQGNTANQNGSSQQGVTGTVTKTSNATLSGLTVSTGTWDSSFTSSEYTYHIAVSSDTKTVTINPTATSSSSEIKIKGGTSKTIQLDDDNKTVIAVRVEYDNTDRKTYVLVFDRAEN